jgi:hypothetical protein
MLAFYGFWHCTCCAISDLGGVRNRNLYGPW